MKIDLISDLHIDHWDPKIKSLFAIGEVKNYPLDLGKEKNRSKILIVAGDICDDLNQSINYLDHISQYYDKVLYVDGNHEHIKQYPELYSSNYIHEQILSKKNPKLVYLTKENYIFNNTCFVGCNGWWNYSTGKFDHLDYFDTISSEARIEPKMIKQFHQNVKTKAEKEALTLHNNIAQCYKNKDIHNIVVVTHTVPINIFLNPKDTDLEVNTLFDDIKRCTKITHWLFGHFHEEINKSSKNIEYISNPRGCPSDNNKILYCSKNILVS